MNVETALILLAMVTSTSTLSAEPRKWSDRTGEFSVSAKFVSVKDEKVYLEKPDGQVIGVPIEQLSYADYDYLRTLPEMRDFFRKNQLPTQHTVFQTTVGRPSDSLSFSPNGRFLAIATHGGAFVLDLQNKSKVVTPVSGQSSSFLDFCKFSRDGKSLVAHSSITDKVTSWQVDSEGRLTQEKTCDTKIVGKIRCMGFHPDGQHVVSGDEMNNVFYWRFRTGETEYSFEGMFSGLVEGCLINPKGTQAVATDGNYAALIDLQQGKLLQKMKLVDASPYRVAMSEDGTRVFANYGDTVFGWTIVDGEGRMQIKPKGSGPIWRLASSRNGNFLLIGRTDTADLWNTATASHVYNFLTSGGSYTKAIAVSPDGRHLAVASSPSMSVLQIFQNPAMPD